MEIFKLLGTIAIDTEGAKKQISQVTDDAKKGGSNIASALGGVAKTIGKVSVAAIGAAATGLTALTKSALESVGELEQNVGGAEKVFGHMAEFMKMNSKKAFSEMGLSASDYLATANKMGALFQGSGFSIKESFDMTTQAMQRASDVASIMGIDVSSAMEAVAGAAKGNFTMMDNLGVAINDTTLQIYAEEKGLGKLETTQQKVNAAMQMFLEKTEYASGNYQKENETLAGSITTLKAAWDNWLSGVGDTDALVDSVVNAADVIITNLEGIIPRMVEGLSGLVNKLAPKIPEMLQTLLPVIITGITSLIQTFATMLPTLIEIIFPILTEIAPDVILTIVNALLANIPMIVQCSLQLIIGLAQGLTQALPELIPAVLQAVVQIVMILLQSLPQLVATGYQLLLSVGEGLLNGLLELSVQLDTWVTENLITPIANKIGEFIDIGRNIVENIRSGISGAWDGLVSWFNNIWDNLFNRHATISVNENGATVTPSASGLDYVPYNNFPAILHKGEAVLTSGEADSWRKGNGGSGSGISIVQNINAVPQTPIELASATAAYFEQARWAI